MRMGYGLTRLGYVCSEGAPHLNPELEREPSTFDPFEGSTSRCSRETILFVRLLPPGLNRELLLLCWGLGERLGFEQQAAHSGRVPSCQDCVDFIGVCYAEGAL